MKHILHQVPFNTHKPNNIYLDSANTAEYGATVFEH